MILVHGRAADSLESVMDAVKRNPATVDIKTVAGFPPCFDGSLDKLPQGEVFYAKQGRITASFRRIGRSVTVNR